MASNLCLYGRPVGEMPLIAGTHLFMADKLRRDIRFVLMWCEEFEKDWQMGAHAGADYWACAEAFVTRRRSGEIDGHIVGSKILI
jgi:hypothetical protein